MTTTEIYKDIKGYEGLYQVSNLGNVRSLERQVYDNGGVYTIPEKILKQTVRKRDNYVTVGLSKDGKVKTAKVHQLVVDAFPDICGERIEGYEPDHINTDRTDNRAINLRAVPKEKNMKNPITKANCRTSALKQSKERSERMKTNNPAKHYTDEWRRHLSESRKGKPNNGCWKKIAQYDKDNNLIAEFSSISEASKQINKSVTQISAAASGRQKTCGGYIWRYI